MSYESIMKIHRIVGLTLCRAGYNDLSPENLAGSTRWWEVYADFDSQVGHTYAAREVDSVAWSPAYRKMDDTGQERKFADLLVVDLHGCSAESLFSWLVQNNIAGLVHPTRSSTLTKPRSRIIFVMDRPVNALTYGLLWSRLAQEVFPTLTNPAHADIEQRYDQPRAARRVVKLLHHDGNLLNVDGSLAEPSLAGEVLGLVCQAFSDESWREGRAPRNR